MPPRKKGTTVLVTGAAGTVGARVVDLLLDSPEEPRVVRVDRDPRRLPPVPARKRRRVTDRCGDLTDATFAAEAVADARFVVHAAAEMDGRPPYEALKPANVDAVRHLYGAAREAGVRAFVLLSCGAVYQRTGGIITEDTPLRAGGGFEQTKIDAEAVLRQQARRGGPGWVILRPAPIYGPGARSRLAMLALAPPFVNLLTGGTAAAGLIGGPRVNWVHAEDVARAALQLMLDPKAYGEVFNVCEDVPSTIGDRVTAAMDAYGLTDDLVPGIDPVTLRMFAQDRVFACDKLRSFGWIPKHPDFRSAYPDVIRSSQQAGWVPVYERGAAGEPLDLGFEFHVAPAGVWRRTDADDAPDRAFSFAATATAERLLDFRKNPLLRLHGTVHAEDLAADAPIEGTLELAIPSRRQVVHEFAFDAADGRQYRFRGRQDIALLRPLEGLSRFDGRITDPDGREVGTARLRFDLGNDLLPMLLSLRAVYPG
jgi:UDP-glucose 4-epimerase